MYASPIERVNLTDTHAKVQEVIAEERVSGWLHDPAAHMQIFLTRYT
jgi:cytidylate kinase